MWATPRRPAPVFLVFLVALCGLPVVPAAGESLPLLIVADLAEDGVNEEDMKLLVDLYSYTLYETGAFEVLNRYERNKLLKGFGYDQSRLNEREAYLEAGELLRAGFLVTGGVRQQHGVFTVSLSLWEVAEGTLRNAISVEYPDFDALINDARRLAGILAGTNGVRKTTAGRDSGSGLSQTLYVSRIKERLLVAFPTAPLDPGTAAFRVLVNQAMSLLYESDRVSVTFTEYPYDPNAPDLAGALPLLDTRDCHTLGLLERKAGSFALVLYTADGVERLRLPCFPERAHGREAVRISRELLAGLPPLTPQVIARELSREEVIKGKLDMLLFNERFLSRQWFLNVHLSVIKPAIVNKFHPLLNLLGLEADVYWYYAQVFGLGAGYAFSLGYPAGIDSKLASHPLVAQHEFRLIPFSFRSAGNVSVQVNLITSLNLQNAYRMVYYSAIDKYEYEDETTLVLVKFSLNMGVLINLAEEWSAFIDLATLSYIIPLHIGPVTYDGTRISGAFGGAGVIYRF